MSDKKLKILVIEDAVWNVQSAQETLAEHDLTIVDSVEKAFTDLFDDIRAGRKPPYDAVLTDYWLPAPIKTKNQYAGYNCLGVDVPEDDSDYVAKLIPAGLVFAIASFNVGVKYVGICTDTHAHSDDRLSILNYLLFNYERQVKTRKTRKIIFCEIGQAVRDDVMYNQKTNKLVKMDLEAWRKLNERESKKYRFVKDWAKLLKLALGEDID